MRKKDYTLHRLLSISVIINLLMINWISNLKMDVDTLEFYNKIYKKKLKESDLIINEKNIKIDSILKSNIRVIEPVPKKTFRKDTLIKIEKIDTLLTNKNDSI